MTINNQIKRVVGRFLAHWRDEIHTELDNQEFEMLRDGMFDKLDEYTITLRSRQEKKVGKKLSACKKDKVLEELIKRDGLTCHYCNYQLTHPESIAYKQKNGMVDRGTIVKWSSPIRIIWFNFDEDVVFPLHICLPTVDHKLPVKQGGTHQLDNLVLACFSCNSKKGQKSYKEFKESMRR